MDAKLIERLRLSGNPDCWTAADEIEALRSTIRALSKGDIVPISDKDVEIERLSAALKECAAPFDTGPTTIQRAAQQIANEFQRRQNIAASTLHHGTMPPPRADEQCVGSGGKDG